MTRKKTTVVEAPPSSQEEHGGETSSKKKKKKRRKRSESQEDEVSSVSSMQLFNLSHSSQPSPLVSPELSPSKRKRKEKKKKEEKDQEEEAVVDPAMNGALKKKKKKKEEEEKEEKAEEGKETRRSKRRKSAEVVEEEEKEVQEAAEASKKKRKKRGKEEELPESKEELEEVVTVKTEEEEEEEPVKKSTKKKKQEKTKMSPPAAAAAAVPITSKRRMEAKVEEVEEEEEEEEEEEVDEDSVWPEETIQKMLTQVTQQLPPEGKDTRSCRVTLKGMDWGAAAPPGHSPEATRENFMRLYRKINPFKTLTTMVKEMFSMVESGFRDRRNRPTMPMHRFLKEYLTPEKKAAAKRKGESILQICNEAWKNLPQEKKEKYKRSYVQDCARLKPKVIDKPEPPVRLPKLPHQICRDAESNTASTVRSRTHYTSLAPEEQVPYIRQSLEDLIRYTADLDVYRTAHPDYEPPACPSLPKVDLKTYLCAHGCPDMPPLRATQIFYRELMEKKLLNEVNGVKRMTIAMKMFKKLSQQEKDKYKKELEEAQQQYEQQLQHWQGEQDDVTLFALAKLQEMSQYNPVSVAKSKTHHIKVDDVFPHQAPPVTTCPKFLGEPPRPVASPYRLFALKVRTSANASLSGPELQQALKDGWKALSKEEVSVYASRCRTLHRLYEKEVKDYVHGLDTKDRRLFLGFSRVPLFRLFGNRDVFSEDFPNSRDYPVFVKGLQQQSHSPAKPRASSDDNEEEEDLDLASSSPKKKLTPLHVSSLASPPPAMKLLATPGPVTSLGKKSKAAPAPVTSTGKKSRAAPALALSLVRKNKAALAPVSESEEDSDDTAWPLTATTPARHKRKDFAATTGKTKAPPALKSESEEEEEDEEEDSDEAEDITPAWHSIPTPTHPKRQHYNKESSSSGFSDSDVDIE